MNVVVTIFYAIAGCYLIGLLVFAIIKHVRSKKQSAELKKTLDNECVEEETSNIESKE